MPSKPQNHIFIIAGEASGDHHGAKLVREIHQLNPLVRFSGVGGIKMQAAGVTIYENLAKRGIFGVTEVFLHMRVILRTFKIVKEKLRQDTPDLVILIDYPGFNLRTAKYAKKLGLKILYYFSPQIWAWKPWRIKTIRKTVDLMVVTLPLEAKIYKKANVPVMLIRHPLTETVKPMMSSAQAREYFKVKQDGIVIGLLPGSRKSEIKRLLPTIYEAALKLEQSYGDIDFILPIASSFTEDDIKKYLPKKHINLKIVQGHTYDVMNCSDTLIIASGTATLEAALIGTPMVIIYKLSSITYFIAKCLIKVQYIGLCNIVANKAIVPELIQTQANPKRISQEISKYLNDPNYKNKAKHELASINHILNANKNKDNLASVVLKMLPEHEKQLSENI